MLRTLFVSLSYRLEGASSKNDARHILLVDSPLIVYSNGKEFTTSIPCLHGYICVKSDSADKLIRTCRRLISYSDVAKNKSFYNSIIFKFIYEI